MKTTTATTTKKSSARKPGGYGPVYTHDQLTTAFIARKSGASWKASAQVAGIKSPGYLARLGKGAGVA